MKSKLYYLVRKFLGQHQRNELKLVQYKIEKKLARYKKQFYGTFSEEDLFQELTSKLPTNYEILMVHSSYSNMLPNYQGKLTDLLHLFKRICGDSKTLVMPAFFFGDRKYNYDINRYYTDHGEFQVDRTPSQMGLLTEIFRKHPEVQVSAHPTHRIAALGPLSQEIIADHEKCITGCGKGSPFDKMASKRTLILGCGTRYYQCMTQTHSPEDFLIESAAYPTRFELSKIPVRLKFNDGKTIDHILTLPDKTGYQRKLHPFLRKLLSNQEMFEWRFHGVPFFYAYAHPVQEALLGAARRGKSAYSK
ncbi:MAG: hypothetical protein DHS20C17_14420 [Cyclobacteriaceae bacterium]|nr:MAG: hypothetical protein DHS20C17_14420 [Cyclobacteriaceae bacterium]